MDDTVHWVEFDLLEQFMADVLKGVGVPEEDAGICADVLAMADKRGIDSHGIGRLKPVYYQRIRYGLQDPVTRFEIIKETPTTAVADGHNGMGQVIARKAMQLAIDKARDHGLGAVAVRNSTHFGIAGYYVLMATEAGMIGLTCTNARPAIAPTFSVENMLGTNPFTVGCPTDEPFPFVLDCATSIAQRGRVEVCSRENRSMPEGWVIGADGAPRTDPHQTLRDLLLGQAALLPLGGAGEVTGGHKGYGYATFVEILSAALQEGAFLKQLSGVDPEGNPVPVPLGHFFLAIDIERFISLKRFKEIAGAILRTLREAQRAPGQERIYTAGEKEYQAWVFRADRGVPVGASLRRDIDTMREELDLEGHTFPWDPPDR